MRTNNNWDLNLDMVVSIPFKKVKIFICSAILMKFKTEQFYMYTNNDLDQSLEMEFPFWMLPSKK